jgi:hypothetical protein
MLRRCFMLILLASVFSAPAFAQKAPRYVYTGFDVPGATSTRGFDINHAGTIAGDFNDAYGVTHGFGWSGDVFTQVDVPGAASTGFWGINDAGEGVGR